ncbi:SDR family NAD(P)-dependent oxidoreductase [Filibacter tadaridae]|uniref:Fatty acyl-CoA reductase n=1 Tax=Filibacter tadaridae TaxID=2483811 RepID=A0A3P5XHB2_9BACL|nr:SDR family NAD(P)-dependent oxidoreductase [Filibacter tadaridae]VDC29533.1 Fatty acyl-CoA reductase [Filibacter tadaridae]
MEKKLINDHTYGIWERILFQPVFLNFNRLQQEVSGKTILITGASSGIGEQVAYVLADINVHLILVARRKENLQIIKDEIEKKNKASVTIYRADLRIEEELEGLLELIHKSPKGIDVAVCNAGLSINRSVYESLDRYHDFTRTMAINYFAPVKMLLSILPLLEKSKGQIVNVSTINSLLMPIPFWSAYQASKSAFDTWLRSIAPELLQNNVSTTSIYLPLVKTDMIRPTAAYENMPAMCPNHVAKIICQSFYTKRKKYGPWWLIFGQLASTLFRDVLERITATAIKKRGK